MKLLPETFEKKGWTFKQLRREGNIALYSKSNASGAFSYEVIMVQSHNGYVIAGQAIEAAEHFPSTAQWGDLGWTYQRSQIQEAMQKFNDLLKARATAPQVEDTKVASEPPPHNQQTEEETVMAKKDNLADVTLPAGEFSIQSLVDFWKTSRPTAYARVKALLDKGSIRESRELVREGTRGRRPKMYTSVEQTPVTTSAE